MTSTPDSSDQSRVPPTLETIPTEIKLKIAQHLDPALSVKDRWSYAQQVEADEKRRAVLALSLVSRSWNAALEELKWQTLVISPQPTADLVHLVQDLLPSIGRYITRLVICRWEYDEYSRDVLAESDEQKAEIVAVENFALVVPDSTADTREPETPKLSWTMRLLRAREALVATAVSACQSARSICLEGVPYAPYTSHSFSSGRRRMFADLFEPTISELGRQFTEVHISMAHQPGHGSTWDVARYIDYFRNAKALTIEFNGIDEYEEVSDELYTYLAELEHLDSLRLITVDWLQLYSGDGSYFPPTLKHL